MSVSKAVIPAAGLGTRFLPASKAVPKEMVPVVDTPAIQYVVEEAVRAGLTDVLLVTGRGKTTIEDHFDRSWELESNLEAKGKTDELAAMQAIAQAAQVHYVRQGEPLGLGHAVSVARAHVGHQPFAVMLGDDIMVDDSRLLRTMLAVHEEHQASVIALKDFPREQASSYGVVTPEEVSEGLVRVRGLVEKPPPDEAPSTLAVMGRYVFTPDIFDALERIEPGRGGELQLTDAIAVLAAEAPVYGCVFEHGRYDIGQKLDYLRATVELGCGRPDLGPGFKAFLADFARRQGLT